MTWMTDRARPRIFAEPLGEHGWRVCRNDADVSFLDHTIGYIDELGGTYEVRVLAAPSQRQYVPTFKEAMACFGPDESAAPESAARESSAPVAPEPAAPQSTVRESTVRESTARESSATQLPAIGLAAIPSAAEIVLTERAS